MPGRYDQAAWPGNGQTGPAGRADGLVQSRQKYTIQPALPPRSTREA